MWCSSKVDDLRADIKGKKSPNDVIEAKRLAGDLNCDEYISGGGAPGSAFASIGC